MLNTESEYNKIEYNLYYNELKGSWPTTLFIAVVLPRQIYT